MGLAAVAVLLASSLVAGTAAPPRFPVVWHVGSGYNSVNGSIPAPGWPPASLAAAGWQCDHPGAFFPSVNVTAQFGVGNCTAIQCGPACTNPPNCANWHMGLFPEIKNFVPIDGGVPQAANLSAHLEKLRETVVQWVPDPSDTAAFWSHTEKTVGPMLKKLIAAAEEAEAGGGCICDDGAADCVTPPRSESRRMKSDDQEK